VSKSQIKCLHDLVVNQGNPVGITLHDDLIVIDIDCMVWCEHIETAFPSFGETAVCQTRKGRHYYFKRTAYCKEQGIFDGARNLKEQRKRCCELLPYEELVGDNTREKKDNDLLVIPIDTKLVCSTGTGGIIVIPPSPNKEWIRPIWEVEVLDIPKELID
jgi:hypothetical protein